MTIASSQNNPRHEFTATASQTTYTITFEFFVAASMILATCAILSVEPTEVPPNF